MTDRVQIVVELKAGDYFQVNLWNVFRRQKILMIILGVWALATIPAMAAPVFWESISVASVGGVFSVWVVLALAVGVVGWRSRQAFISHRAQNLSRQWSFGEDGIRCGGDKAPVVKWSAAMEAWETPRAYLLFLATSHMLVFPKRSFVSWEQRDAFLALLTGHLGENAKVAHRPRPGH